MGLLKDIFKEIIVDVTYLDTCADFRGIIRLFDENAIKMPKFRISYKLYNYYLGNFNDKARYGKDVELLKTGEVELDGVKCIIKKKIYLKCFVDGNQLTIVKDDFVNLQESPAVFIKLDVLRISNINDLIIGALKCQ